VGKGEIQALPKQQACQPLGLSDQVKEDVQAVDGEMQDGAAVPVGQGYPPSEASGGRVWAAASVGQPVTQHHREASHAALRPQRDPQGRDGEGVEMNVELPPRAAAAIPMPRPVKQDREAEDVRVVARDRPERRGRDPAPEHQEFPGFLMSAHVADTLEGTAGIW